MVKVVVDAMGGDNAPDAIVEGSALSVRSGFARSDQIILVGQEDVIRESMAKQVEDPGFEVVHASDVVGSEDTPVEALRRKPKSSIAVGVGLVKEGRCDAFVSAGSTGVVTASASLVLGCLEGIRRPGIAIIIEGERGPFLVVDVGANPQPKPLHMQQYAMMGAAYFRDSFGKEDPRVALLNIGTEATKGNSFTREVASLIQSCPVNFVGNIEGVDLFHGDCEVVVCDGFTGNVLLKVSEGLAEYMLRSMDQSITDVAGPETSRSVIGSMRPKLDYSAYGGALLLGAKGIVTICHGRSTAPAISNAIRFAIRAAGAKVNEHIVTMAREASTAS